MLIRAIYQNNLNKFNFKSIISSLPEVKDYDMDHTDLIRMKMGKVGGQFWSSYVGCNSQYKDALSIFIEQIDVIKRLINMYPNDMTFVTTSEGLEQALKSKKIASLIGIESGHAIDSSLGVLRILYELGARYMTLTHNCNTPWAEASNSELDGIPMRGLTDFGQLVVKEMNRLGMMIDLSHVSSQTMRDVLNVTLSPVIFSHSNSRSVFNHSRNVPDDVLQKLVGKP